MSRRLIVRPEAEADITDAAVWYDSRDPGLGLVAYFGGIFGNRAGLKKSGILYTCAPKSNGSWGSYSTISLSRFIH